MNAALTPGVTVVIPSIPPRAKLLHRALDSVLTQRYTADAVVVEVDRDHRGAAETRNRGLAKVTTEWTAFLDDDDTLGPDHLAELMTYAEDHPHIDLVYPWFTVVNGWDPFPQYEGRPFNAELRATIETVANFIPVTVLARTDRIRRVGGFRPIGPPDNPCDDMGAWRAMLADGARFAHLPQRTWAWHWHADFGGNTSGRGDVW